MGLFDYFKKKENGNASIEIDAEKLTVYQPVEGEVIPLEQINDGVFSSGVIGKGCGIRPAGEVVFAPVSGEIVTVAETKHAIGLKGVDGMELLIHVGLDTVSMEGKGFTVKVKAGDQITAGQELMTFSKKEIAAAGFPDTTAVLIANTAEYAQVNLLRTGDGKAGEKLLVVVP